MRYQISLWRSGQLITAQIFENQSQKPMVVREDALQNFRDWDVVFIRVGNDFEARPLELGDKYNGYVEVKSGLRIDRFMPQEIHIF